MTTIFDIALGKRFDENDTIALVDVDSNDIFLIRNQQTGVTMRITIGALAQFINSAISQADILAALDAPNGVAALDVGGKVPASQLPAYVDDVLEYANTASFPSTGETGKIYVANNTNKTYRWSGSSYIEISPSPGSTDSVTEGSVNLYHTTARAAAAAPVQSVAGKTGTVALTKADVGLSNVDNTADSSKPISTPQQAALDLKAAKALPSVTAPTLLNSWVNYAGGFQTAGYYKDEFGIVHLTGIVKTGTIGASIFTLPEGYRPAAEMQFAVASNGYGSCRVKTDGSVIAYAGSSAWYSLDGITFRA